MVELPACPVEVTLSVIGNKWKVLIIRDLMGGTRRFGELRKSIGGISQKVLTSNLRDMEAEGLLTRRSYNEIPPRVEYTLTELGRSLDPVLASMVEWGESYRAYVKSRSQKGEPSSAGGAGDAEQRVDGDIEAREAVGSVREKVDGVDGERRHGREGSEESCEHQHLQRAVRMDAPGEHHVGCDAASDDVDDERGQRERRIDRLIHAVSAERPHGAAYGDGGEGNERFQTHAHAIRSPV